MKALAPRRYREGDEDDIIHLQNAVFGEFKPTDSRKWEWQYLRNSAGPAKIFVYEDDERVVGHFSLMPIWLGCGDRRLLSGKTENGLMDRRYRGFGNYFVKLVKGSVNLAFQEGMDLCWGFAGPMIIKPQIAAGFREVGRFTNLIKVLDGKKFFSKALAKHLKGDRHVGVLSGIASVLYGCISLPFDFRMGGYKKISISAVERCDARFDALWDRVGASFGVTIVRSSSYLNWRFVENPNVKNVIYAAERGSECAGYVVLGLRDRGEYKIGFIVDLLFDPDDPNVLGALLDSSIDYFRQRGAICASILWNKGMLMPGCLGKGLLRRGFFLSGNGAMQFLMRINEGEPTLSNSGLYEVNKWYVTYAFNEGVMF